MSQFGSNTIRNLPWHKSYGDVKTEGQITDEHPSGGLREAWRNRPSQPEAMHRRRSAPSGIANPNAANLNRPKALNSRQSTPSAPVRGAGSHVQTQVRFDLPGDCARPHLTHPTAFFPVQVGNVRVKSIRATRFTKPYCQSLGRSLGAFTCLTATLLKCQRASVGTVILAGTS